MYNNEEIELVKSVEGSAGSVDDVGQIHSVEFGSVSSIDDLSSGEIDDRNAKFAPVNIKSYGIVGIKRLHDDIRVTAAQGLGYESYHAVSPPPTRLFSPPKLDLSNSGLKEFQQPKFESYGPKPSKSVSKNISNEVKKSFNAPLVKDRVSDNKDFSVESPVVVEKKYVVPTIAKVKFVRPKQQEKPVRKTVRPRLVNTARPNSTVVNVVRVNQVIVVKDLACWVWRPTKPNGASITLKRYNYIDGHPQKEDQGYVDSGCSRHMTGNMSYLSDSKEFNGGYVTFGGEANGLNCDEHVTITSNDPLLSETIKANQALKIRSLKRRVKKHEKKASKKSHKLKRLYKIGSSTRVKSSEDTGLGDQEDASKQERMIDDLDADEGVALVDETRGRNDQDMFDTSILDDEEVVAEKEVSTADPVLGAGEVVTTAGVEVSTAAITSQISIDEIILAKALIDIKTSKPKAKGTVIQEPRKDQIMIDEEVARNLKAQMQAELEEEERLARQKEEEANIALIESYDNTQAMMDADYKLAVRLQEEERG
nr:putative ribonuclease H-like domain-containing protein [Tanacetum cinerariifolium]